MGPKKQKSRPHRLSDVEKVIIVRLINERKYILFGNFSVADGITIDRKRKAWNEVINECKEKYGFDAVGPDKDCEHLRNHVWGDLKSRVLEKRDRLSKTGAAGEELSKLEEMVLEAIGAESAVVEGLPVRGREQWDQQPVVYDNRPPTGRSASRSSSLLSLDVSSVEALINSRSASAASERSSWPLRDRFDSAVGDEGDIDVDAQRDDEGDIDVAAQRDEPSTSGVQRGAKRPLLLVQQALRDGEEEKEKKKQATLKTEILYLQKQNLILQNKKLELEIEALKRCSN